MFGHANSIFLDNAQNVVSGRKNVNYVMFRRNVNYLYYTYLYLIVTKSLDNFLT